MAADAWQTPDAGDRRGDREGAQAYLARQYTTIAVVGVVVFILAGSCCPRRRPFGFASAPICRACGFIGMCLGARQCAHRAGLGAFARRGLSIAFRSGAITGLLVAGLALLGVCRLFWLLTAAWA
jgi:K(+)-stimulated pyrophosphate-energized sodium pump